MNTSGTPQNTNAQRQDPSTNGSTSGMVNMTGSVSPISNPLV